jgi:hypothetical protein
MLNSKFILIILFSFLFFLFTMMTWFWANFSLASIFCKMNWFAFSISMNRFFKNTMNWFVIINLNNLIILNFKMFAKFSKLTCWTWWIWMMSLNIRFTNSMMLWFASFILQRGKFCNLLLKTIFSVFPLHTVMYASHFLSLVIYFTYNKWGVLNNLIDLDVFISSHCHKHCWFCLVVQHPNLLF